MRFFAALLLALFVTDAAGQSWRYPAPVDGGLALIDSTGKRVGDAVFESVPAFDGPVGAARRDGRWGLIDRSGAWVVEPRYGEASAHGNRVLARDAQGWHLLDASGRTLTSEPYAAISPPGDGVAAFQELSPGRGKEGKWGLLSADDGRVVLRPELDAAGVPAEGLVPAARYRKLIFLRLERRWGYVDQAGQWRIEPLFGFARTFSDGLGLATDGRAGVYLDASGDTVLVAEHALVASFSDGLARFGEPGSQGFMDVEGAVRIEARFEAASDFRNGRAAVRQDGRWGYIDTTGAWVVPPTFETAGTFQGGLTLVRFQGRHQYIDLQGNVIWQQN
ncbi:MAG: WG repeat-containing protein [Rhodothermales bacterium]|nr:WG repeat-containing protein [Rhodothermales bacterium]MBO6780431.1 WG repeat-containing protein [Rhodothermales bacterium]